MKANQVLSAGAPVSCAQLSIVRFSYVDFAGRSHPDGEIMVMAAVAHHVQTIFDTLYQRRFPIAKARLIDDYRGDDTASMHDNNTSAFNHRAITGGGAPSLHAYGLAIDLNPVQNPFIQFNGRGQASYSPAAGKAHGRRQMAGPGKPASPGMAEEVVQLFAANGFLVWGGYWNSPIDYQHFQVSRKIAERMASLPAGAARKFFTGYVDNYRTCLRKNSAEKASTARKTCTDAVNP
ncbi:MAG: M15 family metallopeptidase [Pseudomonadota bacterium]